MNRKCVNPENLDKHALDTITGVSTGSRHKGERVTQGVRFYLEIQLPTTTSDNLFLWRTILQSMQPNRKVENPITNPIVLVIVRNSSHFS